VQKCTYGDLENTITADTIAVVIYNETVRETIYNETALLGESTLKQLELIRFKKSHDDVVKVVKFIKKPNAKVRSREQIDRNIFFVDDGAGNI
jgi:hypothetical protein